MKVVDLEEVKKHLEDYARECQTSPVVVTIEGKPTFELLPIRSDDPDFIEPLIENNPAFHQLLADRRRESENEKTVSSLEDVRKRLSGHSG
jgi:hypothetical protein